MNTKTRLAAVWLILGVLTLSSCASNNGSEDIVTESEDGVSLPPEGAGDVPIPPVDAKIDDVKPEAAKIDVDPTTVGDSDAVNPAPVPNDISMPEAVPAPVAAALKKATPKSKAKKGEFQYTVKSGQTLMQVAYDVYGDIYKWKHIQEMNEGKITNPTAITAGTVLSVDQDPKENISNTDGTPYLIKRGDTLGVISDDVYGTMAKWKRLWDNNKKLIKDPNRIYAGFYLYYLFNEQDRVEKEQFKGLQRPAMLQPTAPPVVERDVSSAQ